MTVAAQWRKLAGNAVVAAHLRGQRRIPFLPRARLEALRDRRVRDIVNHAARTVPYYREWFARHGVDPRQIHGAADLDRLPLLDRDLVRTRPQDFLSDAPVARGALAFFTSGTSGTPLRIHHDRRSLLANIAFGERERAALIRACGGTLRPTEVYVGYQTSTFKAVQAFYAEHTLLPIRPRRTFVSLLEPVDAIADLVNTQRPDVLVGYGGWIDAFFKTIAARRIELRCPRAVMYMGEALPTGGRDFIEQRFGVPVLSRYNAVEAFKIGFFCERRTGFHLHEDLCDVRIVGADGRTAAAGESGEVVISNLVNRATVLLNYPIGDIGTVSARRCACGRTLALLSELEGRVEDILPLADGRLVHPRAIWEVFKGDAEVLQYQLTQHDYRRFALMLVTADTSSFERARSRALPRLARVLGADAIIDATHRREPEQRAGGKFRAVASRSVPAAI